MSHDPRQRGLSETAPGRVGHALEADHVKRVGDPPEIGDRVLDLRTLVELGAADHLVGELAPHERVLDHPGHGIGAVEDRDLRTRGTLVYQPLDLPHDEARLGVLVLEAVHPDRAALALLAPQALGDATAVVGDHGVGGREDRLRGAVVLLQLHHPRVGEVVGELEDVRYVGSPETVYRLAVIAHNREVAVAGDVHPLAPRGLGPTPADEQLQEPVLGVIGVLVLVHQDVLEGLGVARAHLLEQLEQVDGAEQEVVEVHGIHAQELALVHAIHLGHDLLELRANRLRVVGGRKQFVLGRGDLAVDGRRREALGVDPDLFDTTLDHAACVGLVIDREARGVAQALGLGPQDARAGGMEGHQPHAARMGAEQPLHAPAHLLGGLVGERDRQDLMRVGLAGEDEEGNAMGQHARLARTGTREDQERPLAMGDRLALGLVEAIEQGPHALGMLFRGRLRGVGVDAFGHPLEHRSGVGPNVRQVSDRRAPLTDEVRASCAQIAANARSVRIDLEAAAAVQPVEPPALDPEYHYLEGDPADVADYMLALDAINFGSGWFPTLRKRASEGKPVSGYFTVSWALADYVRAHGPPTAAWMAQVGTSEIAEILGQDPANELMSLYAQALRSLGHFLASAPRRPANSTQTAQPGLPTQRDRPARRALDLVAESGGSAERLAEMLAQGMAMFSDRGFYKRAQIVANDLASAGVAEFHDLDRLTIFADNLVPHVLRCDGVLLYENALATCIDGGERLSLGGAEREIRACAVHACELIAQRTGVPARTLDTWLWTRGQAPEYKARPRHRCRTVFY